jgi:hypothetical protein
LEVRREGKREGRREGHTLSLRAPDSESIQCWAGAVRWGWGRGGGKGRGKGRERALERVDREAQGGEGCGKEEDGVKAVVEWALAVGCGGGREREVLGGSGWRRRQKLESLTSFAMIKPNPDTNTLMKTKHVLSHNITRKKALSTDCIW